MRYCRGTESGARSRLRRSPFCSVVDEGLALGLAFEQHAIGYASLASRGHHFPPAVLEACRAADGILLGPVSHLDYPSREQGGINPSGALRIGLDLYANIRPAASRAGLPHYGRTPMDLVIVRENTEGFYADRNMHQGVGEFMPTPDLALRCARSARTHRGASQWPRSSSRARAGAR